MTTIRLSNDDLRNIINETISRLYENSWYQSETLCRIPYFVFIKFSDHAIEREYEREISESMIIDSAEQVVKQIIEDYHKGKIGPETPFKIIDRENCVVSVCKINLSFNKKRIHQVVVVTCYVWDGRTNLDGGINYYANEPSPAYIQAQKWNEENQDKVLSYREWKYDRRDKFMQQRKKAEREYHKRTKELYSTNLSPERRMELINRTYDTMDKANKNDFHNRMDKEDLDAIRNFYRNVDKEHIALNPEETD